MPIALLPLRSATNLSRPSRRRFLYRSLATTAGLMLPRSLPASFGEETPASQPAPNPDRFALLSDIHIAADRKTIYRGVNMFDNLQRVSMEVIASRPSAVFIDGDLAHLRGKAEDYATVVESLKPMRNAGLPILLTLGNHDRHDHFWAALPEEDTASKEARGRLPGQVAVRPAQDKPVDGRQAMAYQTPRANWFILDSLAQGSPTTGLVGDNQLHWLASALDKAPDKPAIVVVHHNPDRGLIVTGLRDTGALMAVLQPRRQVKALIFGHTHSWGVRQEAGLHLVNLPPVAYIFWAGKPNGWVEMTLADAGMTLQLHCLDKKNKLDQMSLKLDWRA
jgi:calcineurin-like phosphoesterase family protein